MISLVNTYINSPYISPGTVFEFKSAKTKFTIYDISCSRPLWLEHDEVFVSIKKVNKDEGYPFQRLKLSKINIFKISEINCNSPKIETRK